MIYLILAIVCSSGNSLIMKFAEKKSSNRVALLLVNYIVAVIVGSALMRGKLFDAISSGESNVFVLGTITGVIYVTSFLILQFNIKKNGATVSASLSHMGLAIPVCISIVCFKERPEMIQIAGLIVSVIALLVISIPDRKVSNSGSRWLLIPMVILGGMADAMSKFFEADCDHDFSSVFVWLTFFIACLICFVVYKLKGERINRHDVICGTALGVCNYMSSVLLIWAIYTIPAFVAYIVFGLGVIIFVNLVNALVMHEPLSRRDYIGMAFTIGAIILLNF